MQRLLITCPPMLGKKDYFLPRLRERGFDVHCPDVAQTLSEAELMELVPQFDAWIIGDDPATRRVLAAGAEGRLRVAVKWGVGVDNVDRDVCAELGLAFANTPQMFGAEVADVALGYVIALARHTFAIDRGVREGGWPKPRGISLTGKTVAVVGYGDIGRATVSRLQACELNVIVYDPARSSADLPPGMRLLSWPEGVEECDFLVFTCALTAANRHMLDVGVLERCKQGVRVVNVARGPLIDEQALIEALESGQVQSAALDVFELEPLPMNSPLRKHPYCVFGSHNGSNTEEGVFRASDKAIELVEGFLQNP
ncbi:phosphoglycerate dehydrogenase [Aquisalimonas lutea]|uniref:phosphoglycerate dehydrogenase n=1 Tax=Aquisalimonas lutea TaxID=1327750 RepID=UPI0025B35AFA|nr:phosphoglycerate dehydrogenase [Aquisalimonas lutea]MDN3517819.1 phosphoglycerate dehydrogenase [Aquisalimonas lutea]